MSNENNNYFDLRLPHGTRSHPVDAGTATGGWAGAVACNSLGSNFDSGWACFGAADAFYDSGLSAFTSFGDRYGSVVKNALSSGSSYADAAQAMANAGYDPGNQNYGSKFQGVLDVFNKIKDCP